MRRRAKRTFAPVDKGGPHAERFGADTVEHMAGNEQTARARLAGEVLDGSIGLPMRLEIARLLDGDHMIKFKPDMRLGRLQHISVAIGKDRQLEPTVAQALQFPDDFGKRFQSLDPAHKPAHLILSVGNAGAIHNKGHRALADLAIGRMHAIAQRIDHGILKMRTPPPSDKAMRLAGPALVLQKRCRRLG